MLVVLITDIYKKKNLRDGSEVLYLHLMVLRMVEGKAVVAVRTVVVTALKVVAAKVLAVVRAVLLVNSDEAVVA